MTPPKKPAPVRTVNKTSVRWTAQVRDPARDNASRSLGTFGTEAEAQAVIDAFWAATYPAAAPAPPPVVAPRAPATPAAPAPVRVVNKTSVRWTAQVRDPARNNASRSLGTFATQAEAQAVIDAFWLAAYPPPPRAPQAFVAPAAPVAPVAPPSALPGGFRLHAYPVDAGWKPGWGFGVFTPEVDPGATIPRYALVAGEGDADNALFAIAGGVLALGEHVPARTHSVRVRMTLAERNYEQSFAFAIAAEIRAPNQAPTGVTLTGPGRVAENQPAGTLLGVLHAFDPDGDPVTFTLRDDLADTHNALVELTGNELRTKVPLDHEAFHTLSVFVRASDGRGGTWDHGFNLPIDNVADTPSELPPTGIALSNATVAETGRAVGVVGTLSGIGQHPSSTLRFGFAAGPGDTDNDRFLLRGDVLCANWRLDFEASPTRSVRLRVIDQHHRSAEQAFTIAVQDVNEPPTEIELSCASVAENRPPGTPVGMLAGADPDRGDALSFTLVDGDGGEDNSRFAIAGDQLQTAAVLDHERANLASVRVRATDRGGATYEQSFQIEVLDASDAPTDLLLSDATVLENQPPATRVGTLSTVRADPSDTSPLSYALVPGPGSDDNAAFQVVRDELQTREGLDFERKPVLSVRVRVSTRHWRGDFEKPFTITVLDAPGSITLAPATVSEGRPAGSVVGRLVASDVCQGRTDRGPIAFALVAGEGAQDNAAFAVVGDGLRTAAVLDHESGGRLSIRLRATDALGASIEQALPVLVADVDEAPVTVALEGAVLVANMPAGTPVGRLSGTDPDGGGLTFAVGAGADAAQFAVDGTLLRSAAVVDAVAAERVVPVRATDPGGLSIERSFRVRTARTAGFRPAAAPAEALGLQGPLAVAARALSPVATSFEVVPGLAGDGTISLRVLDSRADYLRHAGRRLQRARIVDGDDSTRRDGSFVVRGGLSDPAGVSLEAHSLPGHFVTRRPDGTVGLDPPGADSAAGTWTLAEGAAELCAVELAGVELDLVGLGDGAVALQAPDGAFVRAAGGAVAATGDAVGPDERFALFDVGDGRVALRSTAGNFLARSGGAWHATDPRMVSLPCAGPPLPRPVDGRPTLVTGPASGRAGDRIDLPIAIGPLAAGWTLGEIEIAGVPEAFDLAPASRLGAARDGYATWRVSPGDLAAVAAVPRDAVRPVVCSLAVTATAVHAREPARTALQFLTLTVMPTPAALRTEIDPVQAMTVFQTTAEDKRYRKFHRRLGRSGSVVFQVSAASDAHVGFFAKASDPTPAYECVIGGWSGTRSAIRAAGVDSGHWPTPDVLNPNANAGLEWAAVAHDVRYGAPAQIAVNTLGTAWLLTEQGYLFLRTGVDGSQLQGSGWRASHGAALSQVDVGAHNAAWGINSGVAMRLDGTSSSDPAGGRWTGVDNFHGARRLKHVSVGARHQVWAVAEDGGVVTRWGTGDRKPQGTEWRAVPDSPPMATLSCAGRLVWGVGPAGDVHFREGIAADAPQGTKWRAVDGRRLRQVQVCETGRVWGVDTSGRTVVRSGVTATDFVGTGWQEVPGPTATVVAGGALSAWGIVGGEVCFRRGADAPTFWAAAENGRVRVGRGSEVGKDVFMEAAHPVAAEVTHVGVATGFGAAGRWRLALPGIVPLGARIVDQTRRPGTAVSVRGGASAPGVLVDGAWRSSVHVPVATLPAGTWTLVTLLRSNLGCGINERYGTTASPQTGLLAARLNELDRRWIVCVYSAGPIAMTDELEDALRRCGASAATRALGAGWSYAMAGVAGSGENAGFEAFAGPDEPGGAVLDLAWYEGALTRGPVAPPAGPAPQAGTFRAANVLLSGLPEAATLSHGSRIAVSEADRTTMWAVPAAELELVTVELPADGPAATGRLRLVVETTPAFELGLPATTPDVPPAFTVTSGKRNGNVWASADSTYEVSTSAEKKLPAGVTASVSASVETRHGAGFAAGLGAQTLFKCPQCNGKGEAVGGGGESGKCARCDGTGAIEGSGARLEFHAGQIVEAKVGVQVKQQIAAGVSVSHGAESAVKSGAEVTGDGELYTGDGRYGGQGSFDSFAGTEASFTTRHKAGADGSDVGGALGVMSPGSVGVSGGGKAKYDDGKVTFGVKGEVGVGLIGFSVDLELTVDTKRLQWVAVTAFDFARGTATTTIVNGGAEAIAWAEGAGATIARGADGAIDWGAGAASDAADFFERDVGGAFETAGVETAAFFVDVGGGFVSGITIMSSGVEDAADEVANFFESAYGSIRDLFGL